MKTPSSERAVHRRAAPFTIEPRRLALLGGVGLLAVVLALTLRAAIQRRLPKNLPAAPGIQTERPASLPAAGLPDPLASFQAARTAPPAAPALSEAGRSAFARGTTAFLQGRYAEAAQELEPVTRTDPKAPIVRAYLGLAYIRLKRFTEAHQQFEIEGRLLPNPAVSWSHRADVYHAQGNLPAAIRALEKAVAADPHIAQFHFNLGMLYPDVLETHKGIEALGRCLQLEPTNHYAHYLRGNLLLRTMRLDAAEAELREALRLQPQTGLYHFGLGQVYLNRPTTSETLHLAREEFTRAEALGVPETASLHYYLARCYQLQGDWKAARRELETSLQQRPNAWRTYAALADTLLRLGETEAAQKARARFLALRQQEDSRLKHSFFEQEAARNPESADARLQFAEYLLRKGAHAQARKALERAQQLAQRHGAPADLRQRLTALEAELKSP